MGADSSKAKTGRKDDGEGSDAAVRCLKLRRSSSKEVRPRSSKAAATEEEVLLSTRLAADTSPPERPPFYAVSSEWLSSWHSFATDGGRPPGPISNSGLISAGDGTGSSPSARAVAVSWLSGDDWHLLHSRHDGGPVLRRTSCELFPAEARVPIAAASAGGAEGDAAAGACVASSDPLALVQRRSALLKQRCQAINADLATELRRLERGPWAKMPSKAARAARGRVASAVSTACGGEELREALQVLRACGEGTALATLDACVAELCSLEEAMIVLACLLQSLEQADRMSLELWLEQADMMGLEVMAADAPLLEPLRVRRAELEERERRALAGHASAVSSEDEGPGERLWRQVLFAVEANDEVTLIELISEAEGLGQDTTSAQLALEELRGRRQETEEREFGLPQFERPSGYNQTGDRYAPPRPVAGGGDDAGGGRTRNRAPSDSGPIFGDPSTYRNTEDFLNDYRRWREQHPTAAEEQERRRSAPASRPGASPEQERQYRRWQEEPRAPSAPSDPRPRDQEDERSRMERERKRREERERWERDRREAERATREREDRQRAERERADRERWYREEQERRRREREEQEWRQRYRQRAAAPPVVGRPQDDALRTLGLQAGRVPPLAELKTAYRKAAMKSHPDRPQNRDRQAEATAEFQRVKAAFDLLSPAAGG